MFSVVTAKRDTHVAVLPVGYRPLADIVRHSAAITGVQIVIAVGFGCIWRIEENTRDAKLAPARSWLPCSQDRSRFQSRQWLAFRAAQRQIRKKAHSNSRCLQSGPRPAERPAIYRPTRETEPSKLNYLSFSIPPLELNTPPFAQGGRATPIAWWGWYRTAPQFILGAAMAQFAAAAFPSNPLSGRFGCLPHFGPIARARPRSQSQRAIFGASAVP